MRRLTLPLLVALAMAGPARADDVAASPPRSLAVTIYRAPDRRQGSIDLDRLGGFALITETRNVHLPAGVSRLRFEGVADGIDATTAIVTGLPSSVIEKNRDAKLLSPSALIAASLGQPVELVRTNPATGEKQHVPGTILSDADGGVVFKTADGVEALRCSGLPETFDFALATPGLTARPTLSVLTKSAHAVDATVTLSYIARGFDWSADYVATLAPDGKTIDLGGWVTLANGNGIGFPAAKANVVAGRLNRDTGEVEPFDIGSPVIARCWPHQTTSDLPQPESAYDAHGPAGMPVMMMRMMAPPPPAPPPPAIVVTGMKVVQEQLGDLKLYRVPENTDVAARESKQVRLLDRADVPVERIYRADINPIASDNFHPATMLLRTKNDAAHHLGLPLPSGRVTVFQASGARPMLVGNAGIRDTAVNEKVELALGDAPDVQVRQTLEARRIGGSSVEMLPLVPGAIWLRQVQPSRVARIDVINAGAKTAIVELRIGIPPSEAIVRADHPLSIGDGRPVFRVTLRPHESTAIRYQTQPRKAGADDAD
ncbi:DUF4139 domain-containing protein [Hephaestia mangrovi]|uniref:DUF4139 domain-containing protein n=1 Tax=Hephaestia mangrovi TaxID=2873268 RepID=UPI001CA657DE|nr:hypothetical protein [Hephaestia mangrovi]MBY8827751.1 hypothetical protein [Hephaestia mangrovi]